MEAGPRDRAQEEPERLSPDGPEDQSRLPGEHPGHGEHADAPELPEVPGLPAPEAEVEVELRPQRRLRIWQLAPIVGLAAVGSLMFAFPLAFEIGDGGAVVAMLGLLISCCAAGWGMMAARRVGYTWPGLPAKGAGGRADWRVAALYAAVCVALVALAIWRVARLR
ncbi:hypothetical protein OG897_20235 [Streptomyces sp. NBC_00237]|uniref:hypothetical protein n=1 Tax=Streptomyces sp. NBC_00237 TaxID=2975687 RepID=UPI002254268D|nr:hypothetical protein [Streptomyces sp. NBC_00237]MCX5203775.1 hypothetical protein [Streptomyces sp. NBC_00237]